VDAALDREASGDGVRVLPGLFGAERIPNLRTGVSNAPCSDIVNDIARRVHTGTYRPRLDEVVELIMAWLLLEVVARSK
jgi:hypothetical protein